MVDIHDGWFVDLCITLITAMLIRLGGGGYQCAYLYEPVCSINATLVHHVHCNQHKMVYMKPGDGHIFETISACCEVLTIQQQ